MTMTSQDRGFLELNKPHEEEDQKPLPLLRTVPNKDLTASYGMRFNTPVEKGVMITTEKMEACEYGLKKKMQYYTAYPDLFVDEILTPTASEFKLLFSQRIFLRAMMRYNQVHITASRGYSKTFLAVLAFVIKAITRPGIKLVITAPSKGQAEQIAKDKWADLVSKFPLLENELSSRTGSKGNVRWIFKNGSFLEVSAPLETTRGRRFHGILFDETRDQDGEKINTIMLPTLSDTRKMLGSGKINPYEPHQAQIYTTSASAKSSYNYEKLVDLFQVSVMQPRTAVTFGVDYRVPVAEGLLSNRYVQNMRFDPTYKESDFAREYLSFYTRDNEESWFNFNQMTKHRVTKMAEWSAKGGAGATEYFYTMSADVGRLSDSTAVTIFKNRVKDNQVYTTIPNIIILGRTPQTRQFSIQARDLKMLIQAFNPTEVAIDTNGLGIALADEMIKVHSGPNGERLPRYGFKNNDDYKKIQPKEAPLILFSIKATRQMNSEMYSNVYTRVNNGLVNFLIDESAAKSRLLATKVGQKMTLFERTQFLMPYEMTSKLFEEMGNLRLKQRTATDIDLERINSRFPKDRFSSLIMGLYRIKEMEEQTCKRMRKTAYSSGDLTFYTGGRYG